MKPKRGGGACGPRGDRGVLSERIVAAARASFAEHGWAGTTMRGVARDAGVDPALVHYYFRSKEDLLDASTTPPPEWIESVRTAAASPEQTRGEAIVRNIMWAWGRPELADVLGSILLTAAHEPRAREKLVGIVAISLDEATAASLVGDERTLRASLVASHVIGLTMMFYVWRIEPVASLSDEVVALVAPAVQRYINGKL